MNFTTNYNNNLTNEPNDNNNDITNTNNHIIYDCNDPNMDLIVIYENGEVEENKYEPDDIHLLYLDRVLQIFYNYEPSKIRLWEIVRTFHPIHISALMYLIENIKKNREKTVMIDFNEYFIHLDMLNKNFNYNMENVLEIELQATLNLAYAKKTNGGNMPTFKHPDIYFKTIHNNRYTILQLTDVNLSSLTPLPSSSMTESDESDKFSAENKIKKDTNNVIFNNNNSNANNDIDTNDKHQIFGSINFCDNKTLANLVIHNLGTKFFTSFNRHVSTFLLPDYFNPDRNEIMSFLTPNTSLIENFFSFYNRYKYESANTNPRTFKFVIRLPNRQIYTKPINLNSEYIVQPSFNGFRIVVNTNKGNTRCYNKHGELMHGLLYSIHFNLNCTFEAIILPCDEKGNILSWRYWTYKSGFVLFIVDVFRIENKLLLDVPFYLRQQQIQNISEKFKNKRKSTSCIRYIENLDWNSIENSYNESKNLNVLSAVVGIVVRHKNDLYNVPACEYKFPLTSVYDIMSQTKIQLCGNVTLLDFYRVHFNLDMAPYKTTVLVYGQDEKYYHLCEFNRLKLQFEHKASLQIINDNVEFQYKRDLIHVLNSKVEPQGIIILRVYYNNKKKIIGYEQKMTASIYDLPYKSNQLYNNNNKN